MTSGQPITVARCGYCGKEFDVRGFQVVVVGRGTYHSTECARLDAHGPRRLRLVRERNGMTKR